MNRFAIIEIDAGMTVIELPQDSTVEQEALRHGGVVIDPGPYDSYEDAIDAMQSLKFDDEDDETGTAL
jgi:hypothetical protein